MATQLLSNSTKENVSEVVLVLGKRLKDDKLTLEGQSRVAMLASTLSEVTQRDPIAIVFCGGTQSDQSVSEADAMRHYFEHNFATQSKRLCYAAVLVEDQSTTTVENLLNALKTLIESQLCAVEGTFRIKLVSNDYHIARILEVETLLPEQGLIGQCQRAAKKAGLTLDIPLERNWHASAQYPYRCESSQAFLLVDQLTTYRVYLEGVVNHAYERPLESVREEVCIKAIKSISKLRQFEVMQPHDHCLMRLEEIITLTPSTAESAIVEPLSREFGQIVVSLRQRLDPEIS
ncbi:YdcF family protein [Vibrio ponticus]|uniref:YdcF family protein n=1 Tax=Vibrio ponticus TaxID=265668 RepID=A0A3N3DZ47_9VIBR|nr:YdcF family protein [Vibrio ponticus]